MSKLPDDSMGISESYTPEQQMGIEAAAEGLYKDFVDNKGDMMNVALALIICAAKIMARHCPIKILPTAINKAQKILPTVAKSTVMEQHLPKG